MTSEALMTSLYALTNEPIVGADAVRLENERERRILELTRLFWRYLPLTMAFSRTLEADGFLIRVLEALPAAVQSAATIEEAAFDAIRRVAEDSDPRSQELLAYEGAAFGHHWRTRPPTQAEEECLTAAGISAARIVDREVRFGAFAARIRELVAAHSPDLYIATTQLEQGRQIFAFWRSDRWRAADVTALLEGAR